VSRRSFRSALIVVLASFVILGGVALWLVREIYGFPERRHEGSGAEVTVKIEKGMKFPQVAAALEHAGVIERPQWFRLYAMHRGLANKVRAGEYKLRDNLTPREVLDTLIQGVEEINIAVTIPEGLHIREVFAIFEQSGIAEAAPLEALARDADWLADHGLAGETAEGYLFPDTYRFKKATPPEKVLETMLARHRAVFDELKKLHARSVDKLKKQLSWTDRELVILASIVEKEAADPAERPTIASVFYNRLTSPSFTSRRLETDPTIRYGCTIPAKKSPGCVGWQITDRLRRAQLDDADNLYNTYQRPGLPPGPISNPGRGSLEAVMAPVDSDYLYFVARDARSHVFSKSYEEHTRAVNKYIRNN
jgi:UPF0755 protein